MGNLCFIFMLYRHFLQDTVGAKVDRRCWCSDVRVHNLRRCPRGHIVLTLVSTRLSHPCDWIPPVPGGMTMGLSYR